MLATAPRAERSAPSSPAIAALEPTALAATHAAALACRRWVGRGRARDADNAATEAMRAALMQAPGRGTVVVGEGAKDGAPMLYEGEQLGRGGAAFDIAVDPLECTKLCAKGLPGSLTTIAVARRGAMARLGCSFYMDKLVARAPAGDTLDLALTPEDNLRRAAQALDRPVAALRVAVLDKPRHRELIERLHAAGARVTSPPDGDVAGALDELLPGGDADLLMGTGGTPEGVMTACAARALGARMQACLAPQGDDEAAALARAGLDTERVYEVEDLVAGESLFAATGVTGGALLRAPWRQDGQLCTESIVIAAGSVRRIVQAHPEEGLSP
ncbi:MAG TPA: fructose-bisphosphatase class II family protein [Solirubrobacteraceae bacterium]|nr:fructose-bisphosphatase class II family protein [Solirubrobacteraceae bacterium]